MYITKGAFERVVHCICTQLNTAPVKHYFCFLVALTHWLNAEVNKLQVKKGKSSGEFI